MRIRAALRQRDFTRAILLAFRLNERKLLQETLEAVPWDESEPGPEEQGGRGPAFTCTGQFCTCRGHEL